MLSGHTGECYNHLTIQFVGIDALFLEVDADADIFEKADRCQKLLGVSCEAGHRFDDDAVDQAFLTVSNHPVQIISLVHAGAGDSFIRIDVNQLVLRMCFLVVLVLSNLCGEGVKLVFAITGYSAVGCQPDHFLCSFFLGCDLNNIH